MSKRNLTEEDIENLLAFSESEYKESVIKVMTRLCEGFQQQILSYDLATGSPEQLAYLKCEAQGAIKLFNALENTISQQKVARVKKRKKAG